MERLRYPFTNDTLFKAVFVQYPNLLKNLVSQVLKIDPAEIQEFTITNPEITPEHLSEKFCRLDVNMIVDGQHVDLEVQVKNEGDYRDRSAFYLAREYTSSLGAGDEYTALPRTVGISILGFRLFDCPAYHSEFRMMEVSRNEQLTDKLCAHYYELPKLPKELDKEDLLLLWLTLFGAQTQEELEEIEALEVPVMQEAIGAYHTVSGSTEFQRMEQFRADAKRNEAAALRNAERRGEVRGEARGEARGKAQGEKIGEARGEARGKAQGEKIGEVRGEKRANITTAKNLLRLGLPVEKIVEATGLRRDEVEGLHHAD